ncbi:hypothetical protein K432DRAFT_431648 [Lepidopterella palustris CBS 459.81]|uniref:Protein prenylyltransferase n=1 Tax=Lepidopterella palustris CBS 459.81 TaxID=1314670 RepID=A0A8E2JK48_9PEZI|nr:hypothetical protein K432DRAFT_431648 [Lepidopterella palustris CBS 459.81]
MEYSQDQAYNTLCEFFKANEDAVVEIEVLPSALSPADSLVLQDGVNIGIPKTLLVQAYLKAHSLFFLRANDPTNELTACEASKIMLLFDPEHLTAANFRKRRLIKLQDESMKDTEINMSREIRRELLFLDSIVTSPLHRQTKSPTLWFHRYWLVSNMLINTMSFASYDELYSSFVKPELEIVFKAGERHPMNYYAWRYANRLMKRLHTLDEHSHDEQFDLAIKYIYRPATMIVENWCLQHPSDHSGWSFLHFMLHSFSPLPELITCKIIDYTLKLQLENESTWGFIRIIVAEGFIPGGSQENIIQRLIEYENKRYTIDKTAREISSSSQICNQNPCRKAINWIEKNKQNIQ